MCYCWLVFGYREVGVVLVVLRCVGKYLVNVIDIVASACEDCFKFF